MRLFILALAAAGTMMFAPCVHAEEGRLLRLVNATEKDYETLSTSLDEAARTGRRAACQKKADEVAHRVTARRAALKSLDASATRTLPGEKLGLVRMLIGDLDRINTSILSMAGAERGLAGYVRSGNKDLTAGIHAWRTDIREGLRESRRCIKISRAITGRLMLAGDFRLAPAH
ncbi:MAG: hypothetical protein HZA22_01730 [Nitrospirae bacterium]|nr:hypothetical protein [Nitrospirota bacterium]MBI5696857.1 hypothetical protein [Nitrospirota bacterium]